MNKVESEKKIKLSIGILVSNQKEYIRKAMEGLKPLLEAVPSELIILDTKGEEGDGSIDIVREYTDNIYRFVWCNDFAAARNACLSYASGEWFMYQDDDEWFEDVQEFIDFFNSGECDKYNSGCYYTKSYNAEGKFSMGVASRMIRRKEDTCFVGRIHETFNEFPLPCKYFESFVHHMGYAYVTPEMQKKKHERNMTLLREELKREGYIPRVCVQMVQELMTDRETLKESLQFADTALKKFKKEGKMEDSCVQWILASTVRCFVAMKDYKGLLAQVKKVQSEYRRSRVAELVIAAEAGRYAYLEEDYAVALEYVDDYIEQWTWLNAHEAETAVLMQLDFPSYYTEDYYLSILYAGAVSANRTEDFQRAMKYWNCFPWKREGFDAKKYWAEMLVTREGLKKAKEASMGLVKSDIKLSIGILVSNRVQYIRKTMEALKPLLEAVPSELIVVDTKGAEGDGSIDIVREYTDNIYPFTWCNDFSAARNLCVEHARGEWFMYQDDDEWFEDVQPLIDFFTTGECENYMSANYNVQSYQMDGSVSVSVVGRMVRRTKETRFVGKVHESFNKVYEPCKMLDCFVHHMGYAYATEEEKKQHQVRNISLLREELQAQGSTPRLCAQLVQELLGAEDTMAEGLELAKKSVEEFKNKGLLADSFVQWMITAMLRYCAAKESYETLKDRAEQLQAEYELSQMAGLVVAVEMIKAAEENKDTDTVSKYVDYFIRNWNWLQTNPTQALEQLQLDFSTYYTENNYHAVLQIGESANKEKGDSVEDGPQEMRRYLKKKISEWIDTMHRSLAALEKLIAEERFELAYNLIMEMQKGAIHIGTQIDETGKNTDLVRDLEQFCEFVYILSEGLQQDDVFAGIKVVEKVLVILEDKLKKVPDAKLEVVFLPYKLSMWDSLESIWMAAEQDEECNAYVIPIPYYSRKENHEFDRMFYEGDNYPSYVPVVDYKSIDLEELHPDVIFFHNPYDDCNYVTSVAPEYYSGKLKECTGLLIYTSYTMSGSYQNMKEAVNAWRGYPGIENCHKVIMQSEELKNVLIACGIPETKLWAMGSPKIDAVIRRNVIKTEEDGVITILLNTTIANLLRLNEEWFTYIEEIVEIFKDNHTLKLIWRPHPLLEDTIKSMRRNLHPRYLELLHKMQSMDNVSIDYKEDAYDAFAESDAMISDYSALMMQYIATGKPILNTEEKSSDRENKVVVLDYFSNYFKNDGVSYKMFIDLVKNKKDSKQKERMENLNRMLLNSDGTCGKKIYEKCKEEMAYK